MKTKKLLFLSLFVIIALLFIPNTASAEETLYDYKYGDYTLAYRITSETEKEVEVVVCRDDNDDDDEYDEYIDAINLEIPSVIYIAGTPYNVTSIAPSALYLPLKSVKIPNTINKIGESAFYQSGLTEVTIPDSVTEIGQNAFPYNITIKGSYPASAARIVCS